MNFAVAFLTIPLYLTEAYMCYLPFAEITSKEQKKCLRFVYGILTVMTSIVYYLLSNTGSAAFALLKDSIFGVVLLILLIHIILIPGHIREHVFTCGLVTLFHYTLASFCVYLTYQWMEIGTESSLVWICVICLALMWLCYPVISKVTISTVRPFLSIDCGDYWKTSWLIPVVMLAACYFAVPGSQYLTDITQVFSRVLLNCAVAFICWSMGHDYKHLLEKKNLEEQLSLQKVHYMQMQTDVEYARKVKHDIKHLITALQVYIENQGEEKLKGLCEDLMDRRSDEVPIPYTGNLTVDGILYRYIRVAHEEGISFRHSGTVRSDGIADMDLAILLGNALENALAGALTAENPFIFVAAQSEEQVLSVLVQNSFDGVMEQEQDEILSRKRKKKPGIGLTSMREVCDRYGGSMEVKWNENTFTVMFILPLCPQDKK